MKKTFDVLIEIPKGSRNKYELDKKWNRIRLDRTIFSSMHYPADYGFVPNTLALDEDPLDVLVLVASPTFPGCLIEVKTIGVFHMQDEKGPDEKLICVPVGDPIWSNLETLDDLNPHLKKEIEHFFRVYKDLEKKKVDINGWGSKEEAERVLKDCFDRYSGEEFKMKDLM
ncbi:inorganic diphosphatase [Weeksellaceae bacterium TAE3-ERU29]|nr:inorganic diphosphatase [Weeksellaceae bacterium TAE3-ERU29]